MSRRHFVADSELTVEPQCSILEANLILSLHALLAGSKQSWIASLKMLVAWIGPEAYAAHNTECAVLRTPAHKEFHWASVYGYGTQPSSAAHALANMIDWKQGCIEHLKHLTLGFTGQFNVFGPLMPKHLVQIH